MSSGTRILEMYKSMPDYETIANTNLLGIKSVVVAEDIKGDNVDVLLDIENKYLGIRVDGKGSGDLHRVEPGPARRRPARDPRHHHDRDE